MSVRLDWLQQQMRLVGMSGRLGQTEQQIDDLPMQMKLLNLQKNLFQSMEEGKKLPSSTAYSSKDMI